MMLDKGRLLELIMMHARPYTMTTPAAQVFLAEAMIELAGKRDQGAFVEAGVWRGGSAMIAKMVDNVFGLGRQYFLYDTFEGMTEPSEKDIDRNGKPALEYFQAAPRIGNAVKFCYSPIEEVALNLSFLGGNLILIKGPVEVTLREQTNIPEDISILRLDTDWYESTKVELEVLYPRLRSGGWLLVDDYGAWSGSRQAVDEFFKGNFKSACTVIDEKSLHVFRKP